MTVPARSPEDDALDRLDHLSGILDAQLARDENGAPIGMQLRAIAATVREALERQRGRIYILENMRSENYIEALEAAEAEVRQLREAQASLLAEQVRLMDGLRDLESAVRVLDVMLREPAAKGLMSAEDYRAYAQGAWRGVDEAAEKARALLSASPSDGGGA